MKIKRDIIGYIIKLPSFWSDDCDTEIACYIGLRGAMMPQPPKHKKLLFSSIDDAKRYINSRLNGKETEIIPVYEQNTNSTTRIERVDVWTREQEKFELIERKRPQRLRKDKFRNTDKDGVICPAAKRSGKIPKLR